MGTIVQYLVSLLYRSCQSDYSYGYVKFEFIDIKLLYTQNDLNEDSLLVYNARRI